MPPNIFILRTSILPFLVDRGTEALCLGFFVRPILAGPNKLSQAEKCVKGDWTVKMGVPGLPDLIVYTNFEQRILLNLDKKFIFGWQPLTAFFVHASLHRSLMSGITDNIKPTNIWSVRRSGYSESS